jgi:hypothetical protein
LFIQFLWPLGFLQVPGTAFVSAALAALAKIRALLLANPLAAAKAFALAPRVFGTQVDQWIILTVIMSTMTARNANDKQMLLAIL